jgi:hypothetical protein
LPQVCEHERLAGRQIDCARHRAAIAGPRRRRISTVRGDRGAIRMVGCTKDRTARIRMLRSNAVCDAELCSCLRRC